VNSLPDLVQSMKKAALDAVEASNPVKLLPGTVISNDPLKIRVEQKMLLEPEQLIVPIRLTLSMGDKVYLLREQGGQKFLVLDVIA
jgi:hypothetical protein